MDQNILFANEKLLGRLILALQKAVDKKFNEADWRELGYLTGQTRYIESDDRLLRSLHWGDDDYGACVYRALKYFFDNDFEAFEAVIGHPKIRPYLEKHSAALLAELGIGDAHVPPVVVSPPTAAEIIRRALADADSLLQSNGPASAVDRLHTALHGYFRALCTAEGLTLARDASITASFKVLRTQHPVLKNLGHQDEDIGRIVGALSTLVDAVNTIRNRASVAHPNEKILNDDEAQLVVNTIRTLFHYLSRKFNG